jgi:hypothetical protein
MSNIRQRLEIRTLENMHTLVESTAAKTSKDKEITANDEALNLKGLIKSEAIKVTKKERHASTDAADQKEKKGK